MALKVKFRTLFPAQVEVNSPILLDKIGSIYTFSFDANAAFSNVTLTNATLNTPTINSPTITSPTVSGAFTVTSNSSSALAVGANGATNPVLKVDAATASVATGWRMFGNAAGAAAGMSVISSGTNEAGAINAKGSGAVIIGNASTGGVQIGAGGGGLSVSTTTAVSSNSASALAVGQNGATNPVLQVNASNVSQAAGVQIIGNAAGGGAGIAAIDSATDTPFSINAKGSGTIAIGNGSTGNIILSRAINYGGVTLNNAVTGTGNMVLSDSPTLTGTLIAPTHVGGSAAGSTLALKGTSSGSPASAFVNLQSNGQFTSIGNASPKTYLDINENLSSSPALIVSTSMARMQAPDSTSGGFEMVSYTPSSAAGNIMTGAVATGTAASPSPTGTGAVTQYMYNMRGYGWNGSSWQSGALMLMANNGVWSGSNQGTNIDFYTTPLNSTTISLALRINGSGSISVGAATDPGVNNLGVNAGAVLTKPPVTQTAASVTIGVSDSSTIFNGSATQTVTLPSASTYPGRWLNVKNIAAQTVNSNASNVVPLAGGAAGTALLTNTAGKWAILQSDGTSWVIMAAN
jgi:hypothetical protein